MQDMTSGQHLNCFTMEAPTYCSWSPSALLIADNLNHIYKFNLNAATTYSQHDHSLHLVDHDLSQQDLVSLLGINLNSKQNELDLSFNMDVQMEVAKCQCQSTPLADINAEVIAVLSSNGRLKVWGHLLNQPEYTPLPIQCLDPLQTVTDFTFSCVPQTGQISLLIVEVPSKKGEVKIHRFSVACSLSSVSIGEMSRPIVLGLSHASPSALLVNSNKMILAQNQLIGIYEQFLIQLKGISQTVAYIQYGGRFLLYGGLGSLWIRDMVQDTQKCVVEGLTLLGAKFVEKDRWLVCMSCNPTALHAYNMEGHLLWTVGLPHIGSPIMVENRSCQLPVQIVDKQKLKFHELDAKWILASAPEVSCPIEQEKIHESTLSMLKHRSQIAHTLQSYALNGDYSSIYRYLHNCSNNTVLNDGLMLLHHRIAPKYDCGIEIEKMLITLGSLLLQDSKYESHLENSLKVILESCKRVKNQSQQQMKIWQDYMKTMKEILGSKKLRKLQQQDKNKRIFELAYELIHTANSHLLYK